MNDKPVTNLTWGKLAWWCAVSLCLWAVIIVAIASIAGAHVTDPDSGRRVHLGDYGGLAVCEAPAHTLTGGIADAIDADERNHRTGIAAGAWQFLPASTWRWVATQRGKPRLAGRHPTEVTLAQQLRQTVWLHRHGGGLGHWLCHRHYGSADGQWVTVYDEQAMPRNPKRCFLNLRDDWGLPARTARTVCGHD